MSDDVLNELVYSRNVIEFVTVANEYCSFVEMSSSISRYDFIDKCHKLFPLLYLKACLLPEIDDENIETPEKYLTEVDYNFLLQKISSKLGQYDAYQEVFVEGIQYSESAIETSISENICDIYQDLKDFVMVYRMGIVEIMTDALWECKNNFTSYWGQKLVNGLRALHSLRYGDFDLAEESMKMKTNNDSAEQDNWVSKHFNNYFEGEETEENDL